MYTNALDKYMECERYGNVLIIECVYDLRILYKVKTSIFCDFIVVYGTRTQSQPIINPVNSLKMIKVKAIRPIV